MSTLDFISSPAGELSSEHRSLAQEILKERFDKVKGDHNRKIIAAILGLVQRPSLHCHRANCELNSKELAKFHCALGMVGGRCVAAACFRHVPPTSRREGWSELLLLAVREEAERRGHGTAMVGHVRRQSKAQGSAVLLAVASSGAALAFWSRPALHFAALSAAEAGRFAYFKPWSHGIEIFGWWVAEAEAQVVEEAEAEVEQAAADGALLGPVVQEEGTVQEQLEQQELEEELRSGKDQEKEASADVVMGEEEEEMGEDGEEMGEESEEPMRPASPSNVASWLPGLHAQLSGRAVPARRMAAAVQEQEAEEEVGKEEETAAETVAEEEKEAKQEDEADTGR